MTVAVFEWISQYNYLRFKEHSFSCNRRSGAPTTLALAGYSHFVEGHDTQFTMSFHDMYWLSYLVNDSCATFRFRAGFLILIRTDQDPSTGSHEIQFR